MNAMILAALIAAQPIPDRLYDARVESPVVYGLLDGVTWGVLAEEPYGRSPEVLPPVSAAGWAPANYEARLTHAEPIYRGASRFGRGFSIVFAGGVLWVLARRWRRQRS